ncbi:MAG TPA: hydantoinase/oxoprolinase family protein [Pirellulales bacterium]|nr:hydantoinase/oxoprolinase family protein [Pirellulales bacterium]
MSVLALDIGGANLKIADGGGFASSRSFALWRHPERLGSELSDLIAIAPPARRIVATMTGELADCFATKADGVRAIVEALLTAAGDSEVRIYLTDGSLVSTDEAIRRPLEAAASNWHALANFTARFIDPNASLLVDVGSTTCDIIPLVDGQPQALGRTDPERLASGELVNTGVERSPVCALVASLAWRGTECRVAQELFATTYDAYLTTGDLPEEPENRHTADGRPATRDAAHDRLARCICADRSMFTAADAVAAAKRIAAAQQSLLIQAIRQVVGRQRQRPAMVVISGQGEFLARRAVNEALGECTIVSLAERLGPAIARVGPAHALAVLAHERRTR